MSANVTQEQIRQELRNAHLRAEWLIENELSLSALEHSINRARDENSDLMINEAQNFSDNIDAILERITSMKKNLERYEEDMSDADDYEETCEGMLSKINGVVDKFEIAKNTSLELMRSSVYPRSETVRMMLEGVEF